jgi:FkbM family methyltransferase
MNAGSALFGVKLAHNAGPMRYQTAKAICRLLPPLVAQRVRDVLFPRETAYQSAAPFSIRSVTGSEFRGHMNDFHEYPFSMHGYFEWRHIAVARAVCPTGSTIVEVGANVGTETVGFLDIVGARGQVHAFEPDPALVARLRSNLAGADTRALTVHEVALSHEEGEAFFVTTSNSTASGGGHLTDAGGTGMLKVPLRRLDDVMSKEEVSAIFMDVEGAELRVLRGAERVLREQRPVIVLEATEALQARLGSSLRDVRAFLDAHKYSSFEVGRYGLRELGSVAPAASNWACIPADKPELRRKIDRSILMSGVLPPLRHVSPLAPASPGR